MRIRTLALLAVVVAFAAAFITPSQGVLAEGFLRCYRITLPLNSDIPFSVNGVWDWETGEYEFLNFNVNNDTIEYYIAVDDNQVGFVGSPEGNVNVYNEFDPLVWGAGDVEEVSFEGHCNGAILDGRLNKTDLGALAFVYPAADGFSVWELNLGDMQGYEQFTVSAADVSSALADAASSGVNQQIGSSENGTTLFALAGGQCQMNHFELDGKLNEFIFDCAA
jgi:hypothetical protein